MLRKAISVLVLTSVFGIGPVSADTLVAEGISVQGSNTQPSGGITQQAVESQWGAPVSKSSPVGEPPISSWEYAPFVVYFEYDRVIHTVAKR